MQIVIWSASFFWAELSKQVLIGLRKEHNRFLEIGFGRRFELIVHGYMNLRDFFVKVSFLGLQEVFATVQIQVPSLEDQFAALTKPDLHLVDFFGVPDQSEPLSLEFAFQASFFRHVCVRPIKAFLFRDLSVRRLLALQKRLFWPSDWQRVSVEVIFALASSSVREPPQDFDGLDPNNLCQLVHLVLRRVLALFVRLHQDLPVLSVVVPVKI